MIFSFSVTAHCLCVLSSTEAKTGCGTDSLVPSSLSSITDLSKCIDEKEGENGGRCDGTSHFVYFTKYNNILIVTFSFISNWFHSKKIVLKKKIH